MNDATSHQRIPGRARGVGFVVVLSIVTIGIYYLYWSYTTYKEIRQWRGEGVNGWVGLLLSLVIIGNFLLPSYVGRMYKEDLIRRGEDPILAAQKVPITGWSGFLVLIPPWPVGDVVWLAKAQSKLNNFWEGQAALPPAPDSTAPE